MFTEQWGVDAAVSPPHILTALVEEAVTVGDLVRLLKLERGQVTLVELTLPGGLADGRAPDVRAPAPGGLRVVAIVREGHVVIPQPETVLAAGDEIIAIATPDAEDGPPQGPRVATVLPYRPVIIPSMTDPAPDRPGGRGTESVEALPGSR